MRVVCSHCGIVGDYELNAEGKIVTAGGTLVALQQCPIIQAKGPQTGQADHWHCPHMFAEAVRVLRP